MDHLAPQRVSLSVLHTFMVAGAMAAKSAFVGSTALHTRHGHADVRSSRAPTSVALVRRPDEACGRLTLMAPPGVVLAMRAEADGDGGRYRNEDRSVEQEKEEVVLRSEEADERDAEEEEEEEEEEMMLGEEEVAEELEGLEEEAMTSEDEGREPSDYDRRAHIFDQTSRVFQALKERHERSQQQQQQ